MNDGEPTIRTVIGESADLDHARHLFRSFGFVEIAPYWDNPDERTIYFEKTLVG